MPTGKADIANGKGVRANIQALRRRHRTAMRARDDCERASSDAASLTGLPIMNPQGTRDPAARHVGSRMV